MEWVVQTHRFGSHTVVVLEHVEDEDLSSSVLLDGQPLTEPMGIPPSFEDIVRIYATSQQPETSGTRR
jgi:hypothetical protein